MKLQALIIDLLLLSAVIAMFNGFGLMGGNAYDPKYNVSENAVNGITEIDTTPVADQSLWEKLLPGEIAWIPKVIGFLLSLIWIILDFGNIIPEYIPGPVGVAFGLIINMIFLFVAAWGFMQIAMKISTKYMD